MSAPTWAEALVIARGVAWRTGKHLYVFAIQLESGHYRYVISAYPRGKSPVGR